MQQQFFFSVSWENDTLQRLSNPIVYMFKKDLLTYFFWFSWLKCVYIAPCRQTFLWWGPRSWGDIWALSPLHSFPSAAPGSPCNTAPTQPGWQTFPLHRDHSTPHCSESLYGSLQTSSCQTRTDNFNSRRVLLYRKGMCHLERDQSWCFEEYLEQYQCT